MRVGYWLVFPVLVAMAGCASATTPEQRARTGDDTASKIWVSEEAYEIFEAKGEATAAFKGMSRDSELICEHIYLKGSHMRKTFCYTRAERNGVNLNHQEEWRRIVTPGAKAVGG